MKERRVKLSVEFFALLLVGGCRCWKKDVIVQEWA